MIALLDLIPRPLLLALLVAVGVFAGVQSVRLGGTREDLAAARAEVAAQKLAIAQANTEAANKAAALQAAITKAQNESIKRETTLRAAADAARADADGLRNDAAELRGKIAGLSRDAVADRAAAIAGVLSQCAARHQVLAERCDRHVNDLRTLTDAWPK